MGNGHSLFHQALLRPMLLLGGEREIALLALLMGCAVAYAGFMGRNFLIMVIGVVFTVVSLGVVRTLAKADPQMVKVFIRHIKYAKFYPAHSTPWRLN